MTITQALIKKFLENRCNAAEASAVSRYLKKHPELMNMYLQSSWEPAGKESALPAGYAEEMLEAINRQIKKKIRVVRLRWFSAAASFLAVLAAVWLFTAKTKTIVKPHTVSWIQQSNTSGKPYNIKLQDGSVVKLAPKALVKYPQPFEKDKRTIYLEGAADFEVAHDKKRPFTVHTKLFATTALGTSFRVSETAKACNISLFTGKVLITANNLKGWKQDIILSPGTEMKYNLVKGAVTVQQLDVLPKPKNLPKRSKADKLIFDNTALPDVMKALIKKYHTPIEYDEDLLTGKYFSGEVLPEDSLSLILKVIANMNGLQVTEENNGFIISQFK